MLPRRVAEVIRRYAIFAPGDRVLVAVSGGSDSLALLTILHELAPALSLSLHVAHFDHRWRANSADDARFVEDIAGRWGYATTIGLANPAAPHTEDTARVARYQFLRTTAAAAGNNVIALGHTQDDQIETLLLHLLRGAGTHGLAGMRPRAGELARPLLTTSRKEITDFLRDRNLTPRVDPSNTDPRFARNRLRQSILPALDAFNPKARSLLARAADILAAEDAFLNEETERAFEPKLLDDRANFITRPPALQRRLLRRLLPDLTYEHIEALRDLIESGQTGRRLILPGTRTAYVAENRIVVRPATDKSKPKPRLTVRPCGCDPATFKGRDSVAHVDSASIKSPLMVSARKPGDRLQPLGFPHPKKLQDILVDAHVPRYLRDTLPIVRDQEGIVWIPGVTIAENKRVTPSTRQQLHLEVTDPELTVDSTRE